MDDLEKTKRCAAAMGLREGVHPICPVTPPAIWIAEGYFYHPLTDNAQVFALVKRYPHQTLTAMLRQLLESTRPIDAAVIDLNRAIVEGVADMHKVIHG